MKLIEKSDNSIVFNATVDETLANAIRRHINQIPILAIDTLEISKNDSPLYDETVAHRVGLIPLKNDKTISGKENIKLQVNKQGIVYSEELKGKLPPVYGRIPITTLDKGQELEFTATIRAGKGAEHAKFSPGIMFYRNEIELILDKEFYEEIRKINSEIEIIEKGQKIIVKDNKKREIADVCEGIVNKRGKIAEINTGKNLIITIESFGQIDAKDIFMNSIDCLKKDLKELIKQMK